jgi:hypothetical protein
VTERRSGRLRNLRTVTNYRGAALASDRAEGVQECEHDD